MTAWSYSYLGAYETCPRRFYLTKILKTVTEPQTEATQSGLAVHRAMEQHIKGEKYMPEKYKRYIPIADAAKQSPGVKYVEHKFGLTKDLRPTGFFAKDVWVRGVLDFAAVRPTTATIIDWKTGKPKTDTDQMDLFAAASMALFPHVETVKTAYAWLGYDRLDKDEYSRADSDRLWDGFRTRVTRLETAIEDERFPPKPSGLCKAWCPVTKTQCEFSGRT